MHSNAESILIGVEFCEHGSLLEFLRRHGSSFQNLLSEDGNLLSHSIAAFGQATLSSYDLVRWSYQVACGMNYLRVKKVLHGDLAARNVLLGVGKVAKVGDFGLSRVLASASANYTKQSRTALPWKWMSIEALKHSVFSTQSDIWSYGVTLYEIFSLGQTPYPGMRWSPEFVPRLEAGLRLQRPACCPTPIYEIMKRCWEKEPNNRVSYPNIKKKLAKEKKRLGTVSSCEGEQRCTDLPHVASSSISNVAPGNVYVNPIESYQNLEYSNISFPPVSLGANGNLMNYYKNC